MDLRYNQPFISKIKRSSEKTDIHNLFIFNKAGGCIFGINFTNLYNVEVNLISSFFTALMSFTKEVIGNEIKTIEMGDIKFVIIEKEDLYYGLLCNSIEHLALLEDVILNVNIKFREYVSNKKINIAIENIDDDNLNQLINSIIKDTLSSEFDLFKEEEIIEYLDNLGSNDEIEGVLLLTDKGKVLYSSLKTIDLNNFLKEVDFRVKIWNNSILKLFYTSKNNELIFSEYVEDLYLVIIIFNIKTKFGIAEYYLHKTVNFIENILVCK